MSLSDSKLRPLTQELVPKIGGGTSDSTRPPKCSDHDADCDGIENKLHCFLYDPQRGYCPYLREARP